MSNINVEGDWSVTFKGPMGPVGSKLHLETVDGALQGKQNAQGQTIDCVDITLADSGDISWSATLLKPMKLKLQFTGKVEGDSMEGQVKAGMMGTFPFTGARG